MLAGFIALRIWDPPTLQNLRLRNFDFYQVLKPREANAAAGGDRRHRRGQPDAARAMAVAAHPDRRTGATSCSKAGTAVIGFDIMLAEPDRMSPANVAQSLPQIDEATREKMKSLPSNDEVLAGRMARGRVVLGQAVDHHPDQAEPDMPRTGLAIIRAATPTPYLFEFDGLLRNIPVLEKAAAGRGSLTLRPERDGVVRRVPMVMEAGRRDRARAHARHAARAVTGSGAILIRTDPGVGIRAGRGAGPAAADRRRTASSGSISRRTIRRDTFRPKT